mmetsp:Transcript_6558/g.14516  ORF Transcript_6558/g.14516 Transcript_6558/m.14516 type:complete len:287 (+) Transcript_6558:2730-3590(+)
MSSCWQWLLTRASSWSMHTTQKWHSKGRWPRKSSSCSYAISVSRHRASSGLVRSALIPWAAGALTGLPLLGPADWRSCEDDMLDMKLLSFWLDEELGLTAPTAIIALSFTDPDAFVKELREEPLSLLLLEMRAPTSPLKAVRMLPPSVPRSPEPRTPRGASIARAPPWEVAAPGSTGSDASHVLNSSRPGSSATGHGAADGRMPSSSLTCFWISTTSWSRVCSGATRARYRAIRLPTLKYSRVELRSCSALFRPCEIRKLRMGTTLRLLLASVFHSCSISTGNWLP